ncbi:ribonuclease H1-like [Aphidius gifuensis]|uniref:ribonuclease H1-like n=1 Tax=Aphidius gifuensis TaxID=684658 RepID=UPI001CDD8D92|nr:ribonuclease H1-like [Aphidius gifuensis]
MNGRLSLSLLSNFKNNFFSKMSYYAVAKGRNVGIYKTWDECKAQVDKYPGATFKKFGSQSGAADFISEKNSSSTSTSGSYNNYTNNIKQSSSTSGSSYKKYSPSSSNKNNTYNYHGSSSGSSDSSGKWGSLYSSTKTSSSLKRPYSSISKSSSNEYSTSAKKSPLRTKYIDNNIDEKFKYDSNGRVDIYTDGACSGNGYKNAKAGYGVYFGDNHFANISKPVKGRATNNNAEIQAVTEAVKIAKNHGLKKIRINTDSEFLINCSTKWMAGWKRKGWKTSSGHAVINREELEEMDKALQTMDVEFNHVRGHAGIHGNEMADSLARLGAEEYKK